MDEDNIQYDTVCVLLMLPITLPQFLVFQLLQCLQFYDKWF